LKERLNSTRTHAHKCCPNCGSQIDHLVKVAYRDIKSKKKPGESKYVRKLNFCCPNCGVVITRNYKSARRFCTKPLFRDESK